MKHKIYCNNTFQVKAKDIALNSLFNLFPVNFCWIDINGLILGCNQQVLDSQNIQSHTDIIGKHTIEVASKIAWENTKKVIETGEVFTGEEIHNKKDGTTIHFLSMKSPMKDCDGKVIGVVNIAIDITERKSMEMNLRQLKEAAELADKVKTEFLINMRHDLKTPLSGIVTISEFLENTEMESVKKNYLHDIRECAESMLNHLNEIIDHVKAETGEFSITEKEFDIHTIFQDIYRMMLPMAQSKNIDFTITLDQIPRSFIGDVARIERVLSNIISNSIKFTEKGYVKITANWFPKSSEKGILQFIVDDSGIGIAENEKNMVFEKFYRSNPSYEGVYSGSGLGLSIVKQFLKELNGEYKLESQLGKGSLFKVTIPIKVPVIKISYDENSRKKITPMVCYEAITKKNLKSIFNKHRVLLVEDNAIISRISKDLLERLNCKVDIAETGSEALQLAKEWRYDLVLLDIGLPDIDGYTVAEKIRLPKSNINSQAPIIAITAHSEDEERKRCLEVGMNRMITKPLTQEIAEAILSQVS